MSEPKVACRNKLLIFWVPACLGITYSIAEHFTFGPSAPRKKNRGAHFIVFADNPSHAIADKLETILSSVRVYEPETRSIVRIVIAM